MKVTSEAAFETAIEAVLLGAGYTRLEGKGFDRERAIFPGGALAFIQTTQAKVWGKLEALHGGQTGERVLEALCKWLDTRCASDTLRHGFKGFVKTTRSSGARRNRAAAVVTAAVTGQIPLEAMRP